jgi:hypothetical protein
VIVIFLAPVLAFVGLGPNWRAELPVTALALVAHLAVPGGSWSGGFTEAVEWGLVTNVAGYTAALGFMAALVALARRPGRWPFLLSVLTSVAAVGCNTRSTIALGAAAAGVVLAVAMSDQWRGTAIVPLLRRLAAVAVIALLVSAPILVNSLRFSGEYEFIRYSWYDGLHDFWSASVEAVSLPVMVLALVGLVAGIVGIGGLALRASAWTLVAYVVATAVLGGLTPDGGLVAQLEATRLMPFQRFLLIYLAAATVAGVLALLARRLGRVSTVSVAGAALTGLLALLFVVRPIAAVPDDQLPLRAVQTTGVTANANLDTAVTAADATAAQGAALLIAGSELGWHQPMWAPSMTDRRLYYDNWLWLWQTWHRAPGIDYDGQAISPASASVMLDGAYLGRNGIGAVVVLTAALEAVADRSDALERIDSPGYAVYRVVGMTPGATGDEVMSDLRTGSDATIRVTVSGAGGPVTIHQTWFPRWEATVDGETVPVTRGTDGQIRVDVPPGTVELVVRYGTDRWDWVLRAAALLGGILLIAAVFRLPVAPAPVRGGDGPDGARTDARAGPAS